MPVGLQDNEFLMRCACYSAHHHAMLTHEPDDQRGNKIKGEHDDWYLSVFLSRFSFWKRIGMAARYVFAPRMVNYGHYAEIVLRSEDVDALAEFIARRRAGEKKDA